MLTAIAIILLLQLSIEGDLRTDDED